MSPTTPSEEFNRRFHPRDDIGASGRARLAGRATGPAFGVTAENISRMGLMLTCPAKAAVGLAPGVRLAVTIPTGNAEESVELRGKIVWRVPALEGRPNAKEDGACRLGLHFEGESEFAYQKLAPEHWPED